MVPEDGARAAAAAEGAAMDPPASAEAPLVDAFRRQVDDLAIKTDVLEKRVNEVVRFYDVKKHGSGGRKGGGSSRYAMNGARDSHYKGMPDLTRQLAGIIRQITSHEWAEPFLQPVDVVGLQLDDYHKLDEINKQLDELRKMVVQRCRKMTTDEKRKLGAGLCHLSPEDLSKALELVAQDNPDFQTTAEEVELDMDAQSETTLWRLKLFVREALERQANVSVASGKADENTKRKREICNALAKTSSKRVKK
uniref:Uncharacterized protein n=1 Tax=Avena sativa TaxID=4498 RepID=A0ACD5URR1_AVESA